MNIQKKFSTQSVVVSVACVIYTTVALTWEGDEWGVITRSQIHDEAAAMIDFKWTPNKTIQNFGYDAIYYTFWKGVYYSGEAYSSGFEESDDYPPENKTEFLDAVATTAGGQTELGNDCSGFVSIAWKLPMRYFTVDFEGDATTDGDYVTCLGNQGTGQNVDLRIGDALNRSGVHIVLFKARTASGILAMEQTPRTARYREWSWSSLKNYRPVRRHSVDENAPPTFCPTPALALNVRLGGKKFFSGMARDEKGLKQIVMKVSGPKGIGLLGFRKTIIGVNHDLSNYYFDSNDPAYSGLKGLYNVTLKVFDTEGQLTTQTFSINVL
ncbi:hypothetical protein CCR95_06910 [Thiocystis minor]|uniref:hypothetical protein n=1 Tax=Thiocystis minor TaxID=61597 RepID=UPI0019140EF2|nr:hypothetical protein [Thiocystis minor]MBK5963821.1 hypothetical protein [Thiocystis minor]